MFNSTDFQPRQIEHTGTFRELMTAMCVFTIFWGFRKENMESRNGMGAIYMFLGCVLLRDMITGTVLPQELAGT